MVGQATSVVYPFYLILLDTDQSAAVYCIVTYTRVLYTEHGGGGSVDYNLKGWQVVFKNRNHDWFYIIFILKGL